MCVGGGGGGGGEDSIPVHCSSSFLLLLLSLSLSFSLSLSLSGNSGHLTWVKAQQPQEQRYPYLSVCAVFSCVQIMVWLPVLGLCVCVCGGGGGGLILFLFFVVVVLMRTDADACTCDCTPGLYGESALQADSVRRQKNLPHWTRTGEDLSLPL